MLGLLRRNHHYARLWSGEAVSMLGDQVTALALPMIAITVLHAPAWELGILTATSWMPYLFALVIGSSVDRTASKRVILIVTDLVRAAVLITIPLAFALGHLTMAHLLAVAAVVGLSGVVSQCAYVSFFVRVIDAEDIVTANSLNSTARSVTSLGGPPAAGWLIQAVSAPIAMLADCASYLVSAMSLAGLKVDEPRPERQHQHLLRDALESIRTLLSDRWQSTILWCTSLMNLTNYAIQTIVLLFASRTLHLAPGAIGIALGIGGLGALVGAVMTARLSNKVGLFPVVMIGCVLFSLPFLGVSLVPDSASTTVKITLLGTCTFLITGGIMLYDITINSVLFKVTPDHMRGRLVGAFSSINYGIRPAGAVLGGLLAQVWGPRLTIVAAACLGLTSVVPLLRSPLRHARTMAAVPTS